MGMFNGLTILESLKESHPFLGVAEDWARHLGVVLTLQIITYVISMIITFYDQIMVLVKKLVMFLLGKILKPLYTKLVYNSIRKKTLDIVDNLGINSKVSTSDEVRILLVNKMGMAKLRKIGEEKFRKIWIEIKPEVELALQVRANVLKEGD